MKAAVLVANQTIEMQQMPLGKLADDECRVSIKAVGVCSSDIARGFDKGAYFYPLVMGHEMAGEVVEVGSKVSGFVTGDRTTIFPLLPCFACDACAREAYAQCSNYSYYGSRRHGGYAQYLDVKPWNLLKIPASVSYEDAAAVEPLSVVLHALNRATAMQAPQKGTRLLIIGAGFLGLLMAQLLHKRLPQCDVTIVDRNQFKLDLAKPYVKHTTLLQNDAAWNEYLADASGNANSFDIVVEATGVASAFAHSIKLAKQAATVIWMGNITADLTLPKALTSSVLRKEIAILGTWNSTYRPGKQDDWKDALALIESGVQPSKLVTHWIALEEASDILRKLHDHKSGAAKFESIKAMIRNP